LVLILLRDEGHDHALDESNLRLSKLRSTVCFAATHLDRSCDHLCDNELRLLCAALQFAELPGDRHHGTNGHYLDDHFLDDHDLLADGHDQPSHRDPLNHHDHTTDDHRDLLTDVLDLLVDGHDQPSHRDPLNHHGYKTNDHRDHRDHRDLLTDDRDLLEDDPLNHHGYKTNDHRDHRDLLADGRYLDGHDLLEDDLLNHRDHTKDGHRDLLTDDRDLGHHFAHMQDDLLDDYPDGMDARHDLLEDDLDYLKGDRDYLMDDPGLRLVCLNDRPLHQHRRGVRDAKVCQILLPVADDVDRDFQGLALNEVYLQTTPKRRTLTECN
jgi:hypothetical protein